MVRFNRASITFVVLFFSGCQMCLLRNSTANYFVDKQNSSFRNTEQMLTYKLTLRRNNIDIQNDSPLVKLGSIL